MRAAPNPRGGSAQRDRCRVLLPGAGVLDLHGVAGLAGGSTRSTARSVCGSRPVMVAGTVAPLENTTLTDPPPTAAEITWLLVRMYPSDLITSPDPLTPPPSRTGDVDGHDRRKHIVGHRLHLAGRRLRVRRVSHRPRRPARRRADRAACGECQQPRHQQRLGDLTSSLRPPRPSLLALPRQPECHTRRPEGIAARGRSRPSRTSSTATVSRAL